MYYSLILSEEISTDFLLRVWKALSILTLSLDLICLYRVLYFKLKESDAVSCKVMFGPFAASFYELLSTFISFSKSSSTIDEPERTPHNFFPFLPAVSYFKFLYFKSLI